MTNANPVLGRPPIDGSEEQIEAWAKDFVDQALGTAGEPTPEEGEKTEWGITSPYGSTGRPD